MRLYITIILALLISFSTQQRVKSQIQLKSIEQLVKRSEVQEESNSSSSLTFMIVGDYGTADSSQIKVAEQLNTVAKNVNAQFVLGTGDNFYDPNGVSGVDDDSWNTHWKDVYQNRSYLQNLKWYSTLGNHDYGGSNLYAEFQYKEAGWVMEDFFWVHTTTVGSKSVAFVHVDTSFLAYGIIGETSIPTMSGYFKQQGWTSDDDIINIVDDLLQQYSSYDWLIVMGHHQIGYSCIRVLNVHKLYAVFQKYSVDAYLSGHSHTLAYTEEEDMAIALSGAAGKSAPPECYRADPMWSVAEIYGFMSMELTEDTATITAYYTDDSWEEEWVTTTMPSSLRREK